MNADLEHYWTSEKELSIDPDWRMRDGQEAVRLVCPLDIGGVTQEGLRFSASAHIYSPDRWLTFQIEVESREHPRGVPMVRFEWRPRSPHNNKGIGPIELRNEIQRDTHLHSFELNWEHSEQQVRRGNLPIAVPIQHDLIDYAAALDFVEETFRIKGVKGLPVPPWTQKQWL